MIGNYRKSSKLNELQKEFDKHMAMWQTTNINNSKSFNQMSIKARHILEKMKLLIQKQLK